MDCLNVATRGDFTYIRASSVLLSNLIERGTRSSHLSISPIFSPRYLSA